MFTKAATTSVQALQCGPSRKVLSKLKHHKVRGARVGIKDKVLIYLLLASVIFKQARLKMEA